MFMEGNHRPPDLACRAVFPQVDAVEFDDQIVAVRAPSGEPDRFVVGAVPDQGLGQNLFVFNGFQLGGFGRGGG